jgi:hypothetical protein
MTLNSRGFFLCVCERCFSPNHVCLAASIGHARSRCDLCFHVFQPDEQASHFNLCGEAFLRHVASCSSQYDGVARKLAAELLSIEIQRRLSVSCGQCSRLWESEERRHTPRIVCLHRHAHFLVQDGNDPVRYPAATLCGRVVTDKEMGRTPSDEEDRRMERQNEALDEAEESESA